MKRKGRCYEKSYWLILELSEGPGDEYLLVHGSILAKLHKDKRCVRILHAWVENLTCGSVFDEELGYRGRKSPYYRFHGAKVHKTYTREQALKVGPEKGYWGEWD